jgi:Fe-S-cluster containining protein
MEAFHFYKDIKVSDKKVAIAFSKLHNLYNNIPKTKGCLENIGECKNWCCTQQCPQFFYVEFLNIWNYIRKKWTNEEICNLLKKAMLNSVIGEVAKGCIFFDEENKCCPIHKKRSFNCRIYGITPNKEFEDHLKKMRELYKGNKRMIIKEQCSLISTSDGEEVSEGDTDKWFKEASNIEHFIGVNRDNINDDVGGGSYRTPHDHLLLFLMPENVLSSLYGIKLYDNSEDKRIAVEELIINIRNYFK